MKTKEAISHFGSMRNLAFACSISAQAVAKWGSSVPLLRQYQLEILTRGKLKSSHTLSVEKKVKRT